MLTKRTAAIGNLALALILTLAQNTSAQDFDIFWYTIDSGGEMFCTAGDFELSGTISQPDAGTITGGDFELVGGFWAVTGGDSPPCDPCDMNCDGAVDAGDIEDFIGLLFEGATPCRLCSGDTNGDGSIDAGDIEGFIECLFP